MGGLFCGVIVGSVVLLVWPALALAAGLPARVTHRCPRRAEAEPENGDRQIVEAPR
jgi:hypothetical protein